jgi:hypothetical protein
LAVDGGDPDCAHGGFRGLEDQGLGAGFRNPIAGCLGERLKHQGVVLRIVAAAILSGGIGFYLLISNKAPQT